MEPLVFQPWLRPMVWGGRTLGEHFGKDLPDDGRYGESWEVSAHPLHVSTVAEGPLRGQTLPALTATHTRDLFGKQPPPLGEFPWLVKLLDAKELLSIQVHPDDERARRLTHGVEHFGKTESWVVLEVAPTGKIFAGLKEGVTREDVVSHLTDGRLEDCLHSFTPKPGDCLFLRAGTVHAVGGGVVMAEVQQNSDVTFRLYDWNRPGPDGKPRALHIEESLESIDWSAGPLNPVVGQPLIGLPAGMTGERLARCEQFVLERYRVTDKAEHPFAGRISVWLVTDGAVVLASADGSYRRAFRRGETVLVPASSGPLTWEPAEGGSPAQILSTTLP
ncbi:MAG: type I phosphomannose isomerase catalytic subunit [Isosphaeraceae bacterium]